MSRKCAFKSCKKLPESYCGCQTDNYFCSKHLIPHMKKVGSHAFDSIFVEIEGNDREKILNNLTEKGKWLNKAEIEVLKVGSEIIDFVTKKINEALKRIREEQEYFRNLKKIVIKRGEIDRNEIQNAGFEFKASDVEVPKDLSGVKEKISCVFEHNFKIKQNDYVDDRMYFWIKGNDFVKIDLETYKKTQTTVQFSLSYNHSCKLPNESFFIQSVGSKNCYIADLKTNSVVQVGNCPIAMNWGFVGCIEDSVYMIYGTTVNERLNLSTNQWSKIATSPLDNCNTIGGLVLDKICLGSGFSECSVFIYDPMLNKYSPIVNLPGGHMNIGHGYILTPGCVFKMQNNDPCSWTSVQYKSTFGQCCLCMMNSHIFKRGKYLYFASCGQQLFRFDTKLYINVHITCT